jgi:hypothetical protein
MTLKLIKNPALIWGTVLSVQRSPYMSPRADMYRQRAADAKNRIQ